jgi:arylsulfatase
VHLDGKNLLPFFKGDTKDSPRRGFMYWGDDGELLAVRAETWKMCFKEQLAKGLDVWRQEFTNMRIPKLYNLRSDPFERGEEGMFYNKWMVDRAFALVPIQALVGSGFQAFASFLLVRNRRVSAWIK